ncbi:hypothetical protein E4T56_gene16727 [Termitomyces sp. T112]|nr:hypothetical protein E4T56_gene16727 [Termitomyces sp. T112]
MNASMEQLILGPMSVQKFLDEFLPKARLRKPKFRKDLFAGAIPEKTKENEMYGPYVKVITDHKFIPRFKMVNTSYYIDKDIINRPGLKPDPGVYREGLDASQKITQFEELELHSELKAHGSDDAFVDPPEGKACRDWRFESFTDAGMRSRSQLIHYATEWFSRQHRRHAFTIFLFGTYVRFIRWDRAGAIVSERFNFKSDCSYLVEFLWRFSHLDDIGRGRDPFVRRATPEEARIAHMELEEWKPKAERPVIVFTVPGEDGKDREFLAWGSMSEPRSLTGRCTRTYPVYEIVTKQKYLLKDAWRAHSLSPEADILRELREAEVEHVPIYICGGDVDGGVTRTDLYVTAEEADEGWGDVSAAPPSFKMDGTWKCGKNWRRITQRFLHRFVSSVIGKPLKNFTSSKHMLLVVSHAFIGHWQAYVRCGIIHRDVSANNILITSAGGILNDWDMAKKEKDIQRHEHTGTWEFMSSLLLAGHHDHVHTIQDDIESFVLIVIYHALRYFSHNKIRETAYILGKIFYDQHLLPTGEYTGGSARKYLFLHKDYIGHDFQLSSPPLDRWVWFSIRAVKEWIETELAKFIPNQRRITGEERLAVLKGTLRLPLRIETKPGPIPMHQRDLDDHEIMADFFADALAAEDWPAPADDKPYDILLDLHATEKSLKRSLVPESEDIGRSGSSKRSKPSASGSRRQGSETQRSSQIRTHEHELEDAGRSGSSSKRSRQSASGSPLQGAETRRRSSRIGTSGKQRSRE